MVNVYAVSLLVFVLGSLALVIVFLWQLASGRLRRRDSFGRGFEPIFPADRKQSGNEHAGSAGSNAD